MNEDPNMPSPWAAPSGAVPPPPPASAPESANPFGLSPPPGDSFAQYGAPAQPDPSTNGNQGAYVSLGPSPKKKARVIGAGAAALALVAGAGATLVAVRGSNDSGAASPEKALEKTIASLQDGDLLGVIDSLAPSERAVAKDLVQDWATEFRRVGILKQSLDLKKVPGITFKLDNLSTSTEQVNASIANVSMTGGHYTVSTNVKSLPLGDVILKQLGENANSSNTAEGDLSDSAKPVAIATVKEDGGWHVSIGYTALENFRKDKNLAAPTADDAVAANGAATPEDAVKAMFGAIANQDVRRIIELLPPDEMASVHAYGQMLVDSAGSGSDSSMSFLGKVKVEDLGFEQATVSGGVKVKLVRATVKTDVDGVEESIQVAKVKADCVRVVISSDGATKTDKTWCASDIRTLFDNQDITLDPAVVDLAVRIGEQLDEIGTVVTEKDGKWFVSPVRTLTDWPLTLLKAVNPGDLEKLIALGQDGLGGLVVGRSVTSISGDPTIYDDGTTVGAATTAGAATTVEPGTTGG